MVLPSAKFENAVATWAAVIVDDAVKVNPTIVTELPATIPENVMVEDSFVGCPPSTFEAVGAVGGVVLIARSVTLPDVEAVKTILLPDVTADVAQPDKVPV